METPDVKPEDLTEDEKLTPEQIRAVMDKIHKEYVETPIEPTNKALKNLAEKLKERGFNFDPFSIVKEIDSEADKQFKRIVSDIVSGLTVGALVAIKNEVIKWKNDEDDRFKEFQIEYLKKSAAEAGVAEKSASAVAIDAEVKEETDAHAELPVAEEGPAKVTPISKGKKKK